MKFRGLMIDTTSMKDFMSKFCYICYENILILTLVLDIANSLSKLSKECVIRLTEKKVYFIISIEDVGPKSPLVWCELPVSFYFKEYNLVGFNEQFNEIYLELSTGLYNMITWNNLKFAIKYI